MKKNTMRAINYGFMDVFVGVFLLLLVVGTTFIFYLIPLKNEHTELVNRLDDLKKSVDDLNQQATNQNIELASLNDVISNLQNDDDHGSSVLIAPTIDPNDYEKVISFLERDIQTHRAFIQQQEQHIIWLLGLALALFGTVAGFFGFKRKKDIHDSVRESIERDIARAIGDDPELNYINKSIKREKEARKKKILFAIGDGEEVERLQDVCDHFNKEGFLVAGEIRTINMENVKRVFSEKDYDILVFQVPHKEARHMKRLKETLLFHHISKQFKNPGIFYCPGFEIEREHFETEIYTTVQYIPKLKETLYAMLYYGGK